MYLYNYMYVSNIRFYCYVLLDSKNNALYVPLLTLYMYVQCFRVEKVHTPSIAMTPKPEMTSLPMPIKVPSAKPECKSLAFKPGSKLGREMSRKFIPG